MKIKLQTPVQIVAGPHGYDVSLIDASYQYGNGHMAVQAFCSDGESAATLSVNMSDSDMAKLEKGKEFYLKAWSENETIARKLIEAGIIEIVSNKPRAYSGFVSAPVARLKSPA